MVKIIVLWTRPEDPDAFEEYYVSRYLPVARPVPNVRLVELSTVVGSPRGGESRYHRVGEIWFGTQEDAQAALDSPEGKAWMAELEVLGEGRVEVIMTDTEWLPEDKSEQP